MPSSIVRRSFLFSVLVVHACHRPSAPLTEKVDAAALLAPANSVALVSAPADVVAPPNDAARTASGLAMKVLRAGSASDHPNADDCVRVTFQGWTREGKLLASSPSDDGIVQCLRQIVPGLAEALETMSVGEERRVWVPADLAFAAKDHDRVTPKQDMTYDIALLELLKAPPVPKDLKAPRSAMRTRSGLAMQILQKGTGSEHPSEASRVTLHVAGWKADGTPVETTLISNHPASYTLADMIPGWREALLRMVKGEKVRVWIPAALAYGEKPGRRGVPAGDLVYELELLAID
jgi:peptidylprolyl isomerase